MLVTKRFLTTGAVSQSFWSHLTKAPLDGNHATAAACTADPNPKKVNLSRGVYKDENGKDWKLPSVVSVSIDNFGS